MKPSLRGHLLTPSLRVSWIKLIFYDVRVNIKNGSKIAGRVAGMDF
jgi:hypothetical protein